METLSPEQLIVYNKFMYSNYVTNLTCPTSRLDTETILKVEKLTRGQSDNALWVLLRMDRHTASGSPLSYSTSPTLAMTFGHNQERLVKTKHALLDLLENTIETALGCSVVERVLDCGMFFSSMGLFSASPDAYFATNKGQYIPIEIKCPYTYKDVTIDEIRNEMKTRKSRYRVKHTAFSLNKTGPPIFSVEKTDPHYRQMQRQMYVMRAPICIYVVSFKDHFVASTVERDDEFYLSEYKKEKNIFDMFVRSNGLAKRMKNQRNRIATFQNTNKFRKEDVLKLTRRGLYLKNGEIICAICATKSDSDIDISTVLDLHEQCMDHKDNENIIECKHQKFFNHSTRMKSLIAANVDSSHAKWGLFHEDGLFKTFCCDMIVTDFVPNHATDCDFAQIRLFR
ncbi:alkaline exonuclease [Cryptophlebia peltastica nucleopolyhedrovirus]|uniref:Alkaline exonuclease n=1 Tax=Cryptophlebia peltastica nucleopolyhedrovirus TaxID=2304025 RepID=A0A346RNY2_9ABAC|nr:alkaline exonuclease [Cryptophlebia peltastica nucleopolyhedrovirus]AXS67779.1 alkaline exonuclease [Cryptophlebia peltastica nucleopolyhedrovirus]